MRAPTSLRVSCTVRGLEAGAGEVALEPAADYFMKRKLANTGRRIVGDRTSILSGANLWRRSRRFTRRHRSSTSFGTEGIRMFLECNTDEKKALDRGDVQVLNLARPNAAGLGSFRRASSV